MDTKPLERFATQARRELLAAVDAQATAVLSTGSVARTERGEVVKKLETEIAAHGRAHVIDKVAYTWFNRIIALRFMDACRYTDAGVVSPAYGQGHGQPEILADAKRGDINTDVVSNKNTAEAIIGLLDGTRRSTDAEGEAYALLLTEYCRYWHKSMPFIFEREGDYTELLVPTGLLAEGAILFRAREVLTDDVCDDVEVIGWLYQFYISERKADVFAGFKKNKKAGAAEIPAATQLFTPHWIVRYLVENSLGRLWLLNRPTSRLAEHMEYYIAPVDEETEYRQVSSPEELRVLDPACGSGHMLTYAFDLLYAIYEEEGYAPSDIPSLILAHNLYGTEIDPRAGALAAFALTMKARARQRTFFNKQIAPNVCVLDPVRFTPDEIEKLVTPGGDEQAEIAFWQAFEYADTVGSLIRPNEALIQPLSEHLESLDEAKNLFGDYALERAQTVIRQSKYLSSQYDVVVANPPYMGSGNMGSKLAEFAKREYPESRSDLYAMFIERNSELVVDGGDFAMITMHSWMFLSSFEKLRSRLLNSSSIRSMAHLGTNGFDSISGEVVATTAFVVERNATRTSNGVFLRLVSGRNESAKRTLFRDALRDARHPLRFHIPGGQFASISGQPISYWATPELIDSFTSFEPVSSAGKTRRGLQPGDATRFVRRWSEVSFKDIASNSDDDFDNKKWFLFNSGGSFRKWYGNLTDVVLWENEGKEIKSTGKAIIPSEELYFQPGITWPKVSGGIASFRFVPSHVIPGDAGPMFYSKDYLHNFMGMANSPVGREALATLSPTLNFEVGSVARLPLFTSRNKEYESAVASLISIAKRDWDAYEESTDFETNPVVRNSRGTSLRAAFDLWTETCATATEEVLALERSIYSQLAATYGFGTDLSEVNPTTVSLTGNPHFRFASRPDVESINSEVSKSIAKDLVSYAVGCMFGRYSLDVPGLVLADQGDTLAKYMAEVPSPSFMPDADNVLPILSDVWFKDDIVERFREFLKVSFGEEHFDENLRFIEDTLGKDVRKYFVQDFYKDHVQRYKKRPIYWMFSSPKGSFNALIYMHRYNLSTVPTVLNEYLREYRAKLEVALTNAEQAVAAGSMKDQREADWLRKVIAELRDYEHDVLYPLATQQLTIDLNDGVKANYPKFYPALKKIVGLEAAE